MEMVYDRPETEFASFSSHVSYAASSIDDTNI